MSNSEEHAYLWLTCFYTSAGPQGMAKGNNYQTLDQALLLSLLYIEHGTGMDVQGPVTKFYSKYFEILLCVGRNVRKRTNCQSYLSSSEREISRFTNLVIDAINAYRNAGVYVLDIYLYNRYAENASRFLAQRLPHSFKRDRFNAQVKINTKYYKKTFVYSVENCWPDWKTKAREASTEHAVTRQKLRLSVSC